MVLYVGHAHHMDTLFYEKIILVLSLIQKNFPSFDSRKASYMDDTF